MSGSFSIAVQSRAVLIKSAFLTLKVVERAEDKSSQGELEIARVVIDNISDVVPPAERSVTEEVRGQWHTKQQALDVRIDAFIKVIDDEAGGKTRASIDFRESNGRC